MAETEAVQKPNENESALKSFMRKAGALFWGIYFVQKITSSGAGLTRVVLQRTLRLPKEQGGFGLLPDKAGAFLTDAGLGWYIKALFGPITDDLPIFGYRRKSWLIVGSLLTGLAWFYVSFFGTGTLNALLVGIMIITIFIAFADVACDGLMIETAQKAEDTFGMPKGTANRPLQNLQWQGALTATMISSVAGGIIAQFFNLRLAAFLSGIFPLLLIIGLVIFIKEEKVAWDWAKAKKGFICIGMIVVVAVMILWLKKQPAESIWGQCEWFLSPLIVIGSMLLIVKIPQVMILPLVVIFIWNLNPLSPDSQYFYQYFTSHYKPFVDALNAPNPIMDFFRSAVITLRIADAESIAKNGMQDVFFGSILSTLSALFYIIGSIVLKKWLDRTSLYKIFLWCIIGQIIAAICFSLFPILKITSIPFLIICCSGYGFYGFIANLSALIYAAENTPKTDQASIFAFMMGLCNMGVMIGLEKIGSKIYTVSAGVQEVAGCLVPVDPHKGLMTVIVISLIYLAFTWVGIVVLKQKGYLSSEIKSQN